MNHLRQHAWFVGLMVLSIGILVFEAPGVRDEPEALSVRPYAESPATELEAQSLPPTAKAAQATQVEKQLSQRPTIRT